MINSLFKIELISESRLSLIEDNINVATKNMKERATRFQNRVRKKSEEIKSLRDGLFNATSLREATKAMALNQAIYVFTVVTVLFTPVSFLAVCNLHSGSFEDEATKKDILGIIILEQPARRRQ
ncbi:hypothetical protein FALCPG4_002254 [Fusarium falciforme]